MSTKDPRGTTGARKANEILIVTRNELGALAKITSPLAKNKINIECFTGYEWGGEAAFRMITDNNKRAREVLTAEGYNVQESTVALWQVGNTPGQLRNATTALAEGNVNTFCAYQTALPGSTTTVAVFNTSDADRTVSILNRLR